MVTCGGGASSQRCWRARLRVGVLAYVCADYCALLRVSQRSKPRAGLGGGRTKSTASKLRQKKKVEEWGGSGNARGQNLQGCSHTTD